MKNSSMVYSHIPGSTNKPTLQQQVRKTETRPEKRQLPTGQKNNPLV